MFALCSVSSCFLTKAYGTVSAVVKNYVQTIFYLGFFGINLNGLLK